jgi:hypothetical protein
MSKSNMGGISIVSPGCTCSTVSIPISNVTVIAPHAVTRPVATCVGSMTARESTAP